MPKHTIYIQDELDPKWMATTKSKWINDALRGSAIKLAPNEPEMIYNPKLGRMEPK